jgi:hypothetical protein
MKMSNEKQTEIEQMAKAVCHLDRTCDECMTSFECKAMMYAKRFYNAGYRKSTDVAEEIFAEIDKQIAFFRMYMFLNSGVKAIVNTLDELKKKYESEKDK